MSSNNFPIIIVSAANITSATSMMSDLIDNEVEEFNTDISNNRIWRIVNKYYTADVQLRPLPDDDQLHCQEGSVDAHIIYLADDECTEDTSCMQRALAVKENLRSSAVRLILARCIDPSDTLAKCAQTLQYEIVPLLETGPPPIPGEPFPELYGIPRARAALHAHVWRKPGTESFDESDLSDNESSAGEDNGDDEEGAVERADQFMQILSLLPAAVDLPLEERRDRAEALVAAFCRALGTDLDLDFDAEPSDR